MDLSTTWPFWMVPFEVDAIVMQVRVGRWFCGRHPPPRHGDGMHAACLRLQYHMSVSKHVLKYHSKARQE